MARTGNTMWNGNYGSEETARRKDYDRIGPTQIGIPYGKAYKTGIGGVKRQLEFQKFMEEHETERPVKD